MAETTSSCLAMGSIHTRVWTRGCHPGVEGRCKLLGAEHRRLVEPLSRTQQQRTATAYAQVENFERP